MIPRSADKGSRRRILFVCADRSARPLIAASLLAFKGHAWWEAWSTPTQSSAAHTVARRILEEQGIPLVVSSRIIEPAFGQQWDDGVILCSGLADT